MIPNKCSKSKKRFCVLLYDADVKTIEEAITHKLSIADGPIYIPSGWESKTPSMGGWLISLSKEDAIELLSILWIFGPDKIHTRGAMYELSKQMLSF